MRLTQYEIETIKDLAVKHFGEEVKVFLFGSRTNTQKKGGDIDLFIRHVDEKALTIEAKMDFLVDLKVKIGDQKIDVVYDTAITRQKKTFYKSVITSYIVL